MQDLLWHLPEPFSWEISENNNCQLHTGKQLKAAGVSMLTPKGFVNKHLCTKISKSPSYILLLSSPLFVKLSTLAQKVQGWQKRNQVPTEDRLVLVSTFPSEDLIAFSDHKQQISNCMPSRMYTNVNKDMFLQ